MLFSEHVLYFFLFSVYVTPLRPLSARCSSNRASRVKCCTAGAAGQRVLEGRVVPLYLYYSCPVPSRPTQSEQRFTC